MNIQYLEIDQIIPYQKNAKKHPQKQIDSVAASIQKFGWAQPLAVDESKTLIIGHCRLLAARKLGLATVPVVTMEGLSEEEANALRLADNKLNESDWDMALVREELKLLEPDLLDLTGFSRDLVLDNDDKDDVAPELPVTAESQLGDIYELGAHRLMCGDATLPEHLAALMDGDKADMVFTDPPYNVNYKGQGEKTSNTIMNDKMSSSDFDIFLDKVFQNYRTNIKNGAGMYVFHSTSTQAQFEGALKRAGFAVRNQLIWNKPMAALGWGDYRWKHEPFYYCGVDGVETQFYGDRTHSTIWDFTKSEEDLIRWAKRVKKAEVEGKATVWTMKRDAVQEYVHPTQKPVELICYALSNSSKMDDIVLDLFGGSGSTLIACEKSGRVSRTMELDPRYVDVIIKRYEEYTGGKAKKLN